MSSAVERVLKPVASLKLTVTLFALSAFLVFAGTLAQVDKGIWTVVSQYFRCLVAWIEFQIFFPRTMEVRGGFYYPGGWLLGGALLVNVLAAHTIRFKVKAQGARLAAGLGILLAGVVLTWMVLAGVFAQDVAATEGDAFWRVLYRLIQGGGAAVVLWIGCIFLFRRRAGIVVLHGGIILMLLGELVTGLYAVEGNMRLKEGGSSNYVTRQREIELAFVDRSHPDHDRVTVVPDKILLAGEPVRNVQLPVDVELVRFLKNASLAEIKSDQERQDNLADVGHGRVMRAVERPEASGADPNQRVDTPAAYVTFKDKVTGERLGTWLVSVFWEEHFQSVRVGDKVFDVSLRFKREYKPYTLHLIEFRHDRYIGTDKPKNYSSEVVLIDPEYNVHRRIKIWMNNPLRYRGETFYQASFVGDDVTILQVVNNVGWMIPYVACMIVSMGLLAHFCMHLFEFLRRRGAA